MTGLMPRRWPWFVLEPWFFGCAVRRASACRPLAPGGTRGLLDTITGGRGRKLGFDVYLPQHAGSLSLDERLLDVVHDPTGYLGTFISSTQKAGSNPPFLS